ncbi:MAG: hypothetical protein JNK82_33860 [Myxococcaceae bacterium]|nr:hypothetical protein [Myxococcaceae bacterium]
MTPLPAEVAAWLADVGVQEHDAALAELVVAVEMAWADGVLHPSERVVLEAYAHELAVRVAHETGSRLPLVRSRRLLGRLLARRLGQEQQQNAVAALKRLAEASGNSEAMRARMLVWAEAVSAADCDVHPLERAWLRTLEEGLRPAATC